MSEFEQQLLGFVQAQKADSATPNAKILADLKQKAQQRGFQKPLESNEMSVEFTIELSDDALANIAAPKFFIGDRVCWRPLPGEHDPLEGGCVVGMKYWATAFAELPVLGDDAEAGWQYLIYLDQNAPSSAWVKTDWAAESDLIAQKPHHSGSLFTAQEGSQLEP